MANSPFLSIETVDGVVKRVEGEVSTGGIFGGSAFEFVGQGITEVLNKCANLGYEHFDTDIIGNAKVYRMKLHTR